MLEDLFEPPPDLASAPREALQLFARRVAVGVAASLEFASRVSASLGPSAPPPLPPAALAAAYEAAYDAAAAAAERARAAPREWALSFAHDCLHVGCREAGCALCQHNPRRVCPGALAPKALAGDALRAACGAAARVELVRVDGGSGSSTNQTNHEHPRASRIVVELTVLDGKAYQSLLDAGRGGDEAATLGYALLANNQGGPLLVNGASRSSAVGGAGGASSSSPSAASSNPSSSSAAASAAVAASLAKPDGRVLLGLVSPPPQQQRYAGAAAGQQNPQQPSAASSFAPLAGVSVTGSSESLLSGQRPPFRLLARALDAATGGPAHPPVAFAVSDAFVVATPRVRTAVKAEIPMASDHVSKLNAVGPQTQAKLADVAAAWRAASVATAGGSGGGSASAASGSANGGGGSSATAPTPGTSAALLADPQLPRGVRPHARVTTVGQFRDLAEAAAADPELTDALKRVLKLTKGWEAACEHAAQAVEVDARCRVWYDDSSDGAGSSGPRPGLVFPAVLGAVDLSAPIGLLRPGGNSSGSRLSAVSRLGAADASRAASMRAAAARAWSAPGHPGWTLWEGSASQDVAARAARGDVVIGGGGGGGGGGGSSAAATAAAALAAPPPPPPPPQLPSMRLPTLSWSFLAGAAGAPQFAAAAAATASAPSSAPAPPPARAASIPASPFGAAALAPAAAVPAAAAKRPLPPTSSFAAAAAAAAKRPLPPTSSFAAAAAAAAAAAKGQKSTSNQRHQKSSLAVSSSTLTAAAATAAAAAAGSAAHPNANAMSPSTAVDAAALQARLSQLVGRRLSGLDMARLLPTFPAVPASADIFSATPLDALEFSRSELAKIADWERQQQQQQEGGKASKRAKTEADESAAASAANATASANAPLAAERAPDASLLRFLSERLQAAPGSGAAGAGLEGRPSGLEGMLLSGGAAAAAPSGAAGGGGGGGGGGSGSNRQLHAPGFSTLPTLAPMVTAHPSSFPVAAAEEEGALAGRRRSSRRQQKR